MADNTISPVVPNVSGGRNVSTGQKAVTQTAAQSGIDFKSYLGGRTAVQDNSTTFLKRRNSYTLNKNNTKEISIKTASKNSPTESEVKKITDDISSQIVEKVTDDLDISEDELNNAMQLLGLTAMDLLNPANLSALYCEVTGNASDPQALVLNADFTALFNDVSQVASENDAQLDLLSQLTASDDGEILDADIVSSADTTEKTVDSSYDDTAASGQNINDTADEAVKVYDGGTQDSSYQNSEVTAAKKDLSDALDEEITQKQDETKRSLEKEANSKIMAINEYSDTVLDSINKAHNEIMFLYSMLNDKHDELTRLSGDIDKASSRLRSSFEPLSADSAKRAEKPSVAVQKPAEPKSGTMQQDTKPDMKQMTGIDISGIIKTQPASAAPASKAGATSTTGTAASVSVKASDAALGTPAGSSANADVINHTHEILKLYKSGKSNVEIAKLLSLGTGEVKLIIDLYKEGK